MPEMVLHSLGKTGLRGEIMGLVDSQGIPLCAILLPNSVMSVSCYERYSGHFGVLGCLPVRLYPICQDALFRHRQYTAVCRHPLKMTQRKQH